MQDQSMPRMDSMAALEPKAEEVAELLAAMANSRRLLVLCYLTANGETSVGDLAAAVNLSQSALSQHLARMRGLDLVATRRDGQTIYYRLASDKVKTLLSTLYQLYCAPAGSHMPGGA
jgi:DNA-binding transcriptional ArsR family regulator